MDIGPEMMEFVHKIKMSKKLIERMKLEKVDDLFATKAIYLVHDFVYGHQLDTIKYPLNWKEAFKERWLPRWLLKAFPVKYKVYDIRRLYPNKETEEESVIHASSYVEEGRNE